MTISFPVLLLIVALVGFVVAGRSGSSGGSGGPRWSDARMPWGGADEPFHPRDRDLREQAWEEAEADHRRRQAGGRQARMEVQYGGDFAPWPQDDD